MNLKTILFCWALFTATVLLSFLTFRAMFNPALLIEKQNLLEQRVAKLADQATLVLNANRELQGLVDWRGINYTYKNNGQTKKGKDIK